MPIVTLSASSLGEREVMGEAFKQVDRAQGLQASPSKGRIHSGRSAGVLGG